ncbi:MAG: SH3 domain-containing protein [Methylobacter sp.]|nr:SH3 domain-containing protein [Methylobacter sp.]
MQKIAKFSVAVLLMPVSAFATSLNIQVEEGQVRSTPSFMGEIIDKVVYGDSVELVKEQGPWRQVNTQRKEGWIHQSAISEAKVDLVSGGDVSQGASGKEIALAGKGFNPDVENAYKASHQQVSFVWVDKMEKYAVNKADIAQFIKDGGLRETGL